MNPIQTIIALVTVLVAAGCSGLQPGVACRQISTHKDVLHFRIELPAPIAAKRYVAIAGARLVEATAQLETRAGDYLHPVYGDESLYEIRYSFHSHGQLLATVVYRDSNTSTRSAGISAGLTHQHTFVHRAGLVGVRR